jgi:hypothetical protein
MNMNANPNYPIVDGFILNTSLRCNLRYSAMVLARYEAMRRAGGLRSKCWVAPQNAQQVIPAYDSFEESIPIPPGSIIWAYNFVNAEVSGVTNPGPFSMQISDSCSDTPMFSEVIRTDNMRVSDGIESRHGQQLLSRPLVIAEPGQLNIQICSFQDFDALGVQVILYGGEPN